MEDALNGRNDRGLPPPAKRQKVLDKEEALHLRKEYIA